MHDALNLEALCARFTAGERLKFLFFWSHQSNRREVGAACLSQWFPAEFVVGDDCYPTAEHYMMAEKARLFGDQAARRAILGAPDPGAAKALGRQVRNFDEAAWAAHRFGIVCRGNEAKFSQNPDLRDFLARTGSRVLVEASPVDRVWGIGMAQDDEHARNPNLWRGLNLLGFALMQVRQHIDA
ncbi:MAG: NADAR family protein [Rubrivivax sp.]|nr:NADAR family protein [Rubrivivax sp.]